MRALTLVILLVTASFAGCVTVQDDETVTTTHVTGGFSETHVFDGDYETDDDFARVLETGPYDFLPQELTVLESDVDGAEIQVGVLRPDVPEGEKVPVVVFASPYYFGGLQNLDFRERLARLAENLVPHGYAIGLVPTRGTSDNGGCMELMSAAERADVSQAVTWLATQEWANGNAGMIGVSYDGSTPWMVAAEGNPHLKTIVPISGVNDIHHLTFRNGTTEYRGPAYINTLYYAFGFGVYNPLMGRSAAHTLEGAACPEAWKGIAASMHSSATGERDPFGFWAERNMRPPVEENYDGSILLAHGLQDWNVDIGHAYPWVNDLEARGTVVKHVLGQWGHAWPDSSTWNEDLVRWDWAEVLLRWFDYWLKEDTSVDLGPRAQVQDSSMQWRSEDAWPPRDAEATPFHLAPDGALEREPASATDAVVVGMDPTYVPPTHNAAQAFLPETIADTCPGCAVFETAPFGETFRFAGTPTLHAAVTPTGPGGHVTAHLFVVDGDEETRVGWGQIDLRFADGGEDASVVVPGEELVAKMRLEPLDVVVPEGARLVLVLHQGGHGWRLPSTPTYPVSVAVGGDASVLTVGAFERDPEAFFTPPRAS